MPILLAPALLATVFAGCDGDDGKNAPAPSASASATATLGPSATSSLEGRISQAYLAYWDAYSQALLELDPSLVQQMAQGAQLERIKQEIDGFRAQGVALRVVVEHNFVIIDASPAAATVVDQIVNNSFFVDPITKEPPTAEGSGEHLKDTYQLENVGGRWIVTNGSRQR